MKLLSLVQDEDQKVAADILSSRGAIWGLLADATTFARSARHHKVMIPK
jgi:hypothetical protein